jgi:hypothetical protein
VEEERWRWRWHGAEEMGGDWEFGVRAGVMGVWLAFLQGGEKLVSVSGDSFCYLVEAEFHVMSHFT